MPSKNYSILVVQAINDANPFLIGVKLGKICLRLDIPVKDVAEYLGVKPQTIRNWFFGQHDVSPRHWHKVEELVKKLG